MGVDMDQLGVAPIELQLALSQFTRLAYRRNQFLQLRAHGHRHSFLQRLSVNILRQTQQLPQGGVGQLDPVFRVQNQHAFYHTVQQRVLLE